MKENFTFAKVQHFQTRRKGSAKLGRADGRALFNTSQHPAFDIV